MAQQTLLERQAYLDVLGETLRDVAESGGRIALVSGEAGIGKTSLLEQFEFVYGKTHAVLWGACDALFTPAPLAPLHDIAGRMRHPLGDLLLREAPRGLIFSTLLHELRDASAPVILIFEDVHWADEATLDLIKYLGRRIQQTSALFILSYRDDEVRTGHPLWLVLGDLPTRLTRRLSLPPLTEQSVARLAGQASGAAARDLFLITGGNPFFVTEALASSAAGLPTTVRDAVLTRAARLSSGAREILDVVAIAPARLERWALDALAPSAPGLDECVEAGMLRLDDTAVAFRHELARQAIEVALSPEWARSLHRRALEALMGQTEHPFPTARLVHHALHAGDAELIVRFAPIAAQEAVAQGAHREAAVQYATALRFADALPLEQRATLHEQLAYECYLTSQIERAVEARSAALAICRQLAERERIGRNLRWLSRLVWFLGQEASAIGYAEEAIALLQTVPPGRELAWACSNRAQLYMIAEQAAKAEQWGQRAITLAEELGDHEILAHALNNVGTALLHAGDERGRPLLGRSLELALKHDFEEHAARAYSNLASCAINAYDYARAADYLQDGISYCVERDLDSWRLSMTAWRARFRLEQGDWAGADEDTALVLGTYSSTAASRLPALAVRGYLRARRGDLGAEALLQNTLDLALETQELQRIAPMIAAHAEVAWLHGDLASRQAEIERVFALAQARHYSRAQGELGYWLWRAGALNQLPPECDSPYALQIAGDWRGAADAWERLGCPWERALALLDGDATALQEALEIARRLGAYPLTQVILKRLRKQGVRGVPRGPRASTQRNPAGLTNREVELLALVAEGLSNPQIAARLSISAKTVDHHVSAAMGKLNAHSRAQAVVSAYRLGALASSAEGGAK
jgi:DNA-binding CsgD family transcriptional regulator/Tfp pilus assembly protein PilF